MKRRLLCSVRCGLLAILSLGAWRTAPALEFPGPAPGPAQARFDGDTIVLENNVLRATWTTKDEHLRPQAFVNKITGETLSLNEREAFIIHASCSPTPSRTIRASELELRPCELERPMRDRPPEYWWAPAKGKRLAYDFYGDEGLHIRWSAQLLDDCNYITQDLAIDVESYHYLIELHEVVFLDTPASGAVVNSDVDGAVVTTRSQFFGITHPCAKNRVVPLSKDHQEARVRCSLSGYDVLQNERNPTRVDFVWGIMDPNQARRGFLHYLERERAARYHSFLHYNNGSEIGCVYWAKQHYGQPGEFVEFRASQEKKWIELIDTFGRELVEKREVRLDSFVHDHGWDDENVVWQFHAGYPHGFAAARKAALRYGADIGVWLSPWGGYAGKKARLEAGLRQGFETNKAGLSLAGAWYLRRFRAACLGFVSSEKVNYFKFDGIAGGVNKNGPAGFGSDVDALLQLIVELRSSNPELFINVSTGTWPSPFWLRWADCIWRQGRDTELNGKGSDRQRWITYRDREILHGTVKRAPLFPISSLMIHGIYVNKLPLSGNPYDPKSPRPTYDPVDITAEIRSFFGTGVNCQELYIDPDLMTPRLWDVLAEAAKWSRANSDTLVDSHWIGGDPGQSEVYGFAAWSPRKGIVSLRNPDDQPRKFALDVGPVFELPAGAATRYTLKSPWQDDAEKPTLQAEAGKPVEIELQPFEVQIFDAQSVTP